MSSSLLDNGSPSAPSIGMIVSAVVALCVLAGLGGFVVLAWRDRGAADTLFIACLRKLNHLYLRWMHRLVASGPDPLPPDGPAIVVANHRNAIDPLALSAYTTRRIHFLMAREYYETPGLRWLFRTLNAIPVRRDGNDLVATKRALKALRAGHVLGIFPEGGIRLGPRSEQANEPGNPAVKAGAALLALRTGVPILPAYIEGGPATDSVLRDVLKPSTCRVIFGSELRFAPPGARAATREEIDEATRRIFEMIRALEEQTSAGAARS